MPSSRVKNHQIFQHVHKKIKKIMIFYFTWYIFPFLCLVVIMARSHNAVVMKLFAGEKDNTAAFL